MIEFKDWISTQKFTDKPWMILGKGPTYANIGEVEIEKYHTLSLNHVVRERRVDVAHIIDIDVVETCAEQLKENCQWLIMPRKPHVSSLPSEFLTLEDWMNNIPILKEMDALGKLVVYDLVMQAESKNPFEIPVLYFSSEAALGLLARMGVKEVRSLGVDGGRKYSASFNDKDSTTKLINGQPSFDLQFERLEKIADENQIDYRAMIEPMLVFVGTDESQMIATRVLEYTIHKYSSKPVRVIPLLDVKVPTPKDEKNRPRTGFSFYRFAIPKLSKYRGRSLYVDSDMQVFTDIAELWDIPFGDQKVLCTTQGVPDAWKDYQWFHPGRQFSVMMLDCSRLDWDVEKVVQGLDEGRYTYQNLMFDFCLVKPEEIEDRLPSRWNCLEHYEEGESSLVHYTVIPTQPWLVDENPLCQLWVDAFEEAVKAGWISRREIEWHLEKGYLRKSLAYVADFAKIASSGTDALPAESPEVGSSAPLQRLIKAYRRAVNEIHIAKTAATESKLAELESMRAEKAAKLELAEVKERLSAALSEVETYRKNLDDTIKTTAGVEKEYRSRVEQLEADKHLIYSSKTWRLGRLMTKPVELLRKN
jgi:hypothetical protein